jgi:predicted methyltransferase
VIATKLKPNKDLLFLKNLFILFILIFSFSLSADPLQKAINNEFRDVKNASRDFHRNPYETLSFFELEPFMTVVELSPGSGWYTEILASYLQNSGTLIAAHFNKNSTNNYLKTSRLNFEKKIISDPAYNKVKIVDLTSKLSEPESVDAVLTFRNLHNWFGPMMDKVFLNTFTALKSGGIFGVVEHRAKSGTPMKEMKESGYVTEEYAIEIAKKHGFKLISRSEINANPKDTKNHPKGVWTLPPSFRLKEKNKDKYAAIGESDRMTLLFKKP